MIGQLDSASEAPSLDLVASIVIVNYRSGRDLLECLDAIAEHTTAKYEVLVVDNDSSDGSVSQVRERYPFVKVVDMGHNAGYGRAINVGGDLARAPFLVVLNPDVVVTERWLEPLVAVLESDPAIGGVTPCMVLHDDPETLNALGLDIHCTLLGFNRGLHRSVRRMGRDTVRVNGVHGGAFAVRKDVFMRVGGMNPAYFLYHEDVELSLRLLLAGHTILAVPASMVRHKYELHMTPHKLHWLERHRWLTLASTFQFSTLVVLSPLLMLTEAMVFAYVLLRGPAFLWAKLRAIWWMARNWDLARRSRRRTDFVRRRSDLELLAMLGISYHADQLTTIARKKRTRTGSSARSAVRRTPSVGGSVRRLPDSEESVG